VRSYLAEFLSDPRVVRLPRALWLPVLHGIVLRTRPGKSAQKYAQIWTPEGSPLAVNTRKQADALQGLLPDAKVEHAMRYGEPSIAAALAKLAGREVTALPLYPQYAHSTTQSVADKLPPGVRMIRDFHDHPAYIAALAASMRRHWSKQGRGALLVLSFHGLPKRGGEGYAQQCRVTARLLQEQLQCEAIVSFQSRFGYAAWLQPYTEPTLVALAAAGKKRVDVFCPGFVADCLETLEEIGITAKQKYLQAGGSELHLVPCLNDSPEWIAALAEIVSARSGP
jgi:protoporphyrin/coproporphyrin ferrochelatase